MVGFTEQLRQHPEASRLLSHTDAYEVLNLLQSHPNVKLLLSGHTHLTESIAFGGLDLINSGAVSGLWWKGKFRHTAEGYNVIELFDDGTHRSHYETYGWRAA
jgi:predicted phosphodiesterase